MACFPSKPGRRLHMLALPSSPEGLAHPTMSKLSSELDSVNFGPGFVASPILKQSIKKQNCSFRWKLEKK